MILAALIAVMVVLIAVIELSADTDPHSAFLFTLLDHIVSDESSLDASSRAGSGPENLRQHAA